MLHNAMTWQARAACAPCSLAWWPQRRRGASGCAVGHRADPCCACVALLLCVLRFGSPSPPCRGGAAGRHADLRTARQHQRHRSAAPRERHPADCRGPCRINGDAGSRRKDGGGTESRSRRSLRPSLPPPMPISKPRAAPHPHRRPPPAPLAPQFVGFYEDLGADFWRLKTTIFSDVSINVHAPPPTLLSRLALNASSALRCPPQCASPARFSRTVVPTPPFHARGAVSSYSTRFRSRSGAVPRSPSRGCTSSSSARSTQRSVGTAQRPRAAAAGAKEGCGQGGVWVMTQRPPLPVAISVSLPLPSHSPPTPSHPTHPLSSTPPLLAGGAGGDADLHRPRPAALPVGTPALQAGPRALPFLVGLLCGRCLRVLVSGSGESRPGASIARCGGGDGAASPCVSLPRTAIAHLRPQANVLESALVALLWLAVGSCMCCVACAPFACVCRLLRRWRFCRR